MIDLKQLQCFLVCTDTGSFSEAARILYMTQSNVSKMMKALELRVGSTLFVRHAKGISLTPEGRRIYQYASRIMDEVGALEDFSAGRTREWLNISSNPSSWFADCFVEFYKARKEAHVNGGIYKERKETHVHSHVYTGSTKNIIKRLAEYKDELGFVYVLESKMSQFSYNVNRNHLEFIPLTNLLVTLYPGKENQWHGADSISKEAMESLQYVQNFQDELLEDPLVGNEDASPSKHLDVAVVTNSDYIMQKMLKETDLVNISGSYMNGTVRHNGHQGIVIDWEEGKLIFGVLHRKDEAYSKEGAEFVRFMKERIAREN